MANTKKYLIAMQPELHEKLKILAADADLTLGDAIGIMVHACENRVDLAEMTNTLPYQDEVDYTNSKGRENSMLHKTHLFTFRDQAEIYKIEDERRLPKIPRPFLSFGKST